jgi:hypothetical protein
MNTRLRVDIKYCTRTDILYSMLSFKRNLFRRIVHNNFIALSGNMPTELRNNCKWCVYIDNNNSKVVRREKKN